VDELNGGGKSLNIHVISKSDQKAQQSNKTFENRPNKIELKFNKVLNNLILLIFYA
jgi:hypothetical protein